VGGRESAPFYFISIDWRQRILVTARKGPQVLSDLHVTFRVSIYLFNLAGEKSRKE
jgi:hypothetical protein